MRGMRSGLAALSAALLLTGCSAEELLTETPQTIQLPESRTESAASQTEEEDESFSLLEEGGSRFAYESLTAGEQIWYDEIEGALGSMAETISLSEEPLEQGLDETDIDRIFQCVLIDHPEIFYTTGYTYTKYSRGERTVGIDFAGTYETSGEEAALVAEQIRAVVDAWCAEVPADASAYDRVKYHIFHRL